MRVFAIVLEGFYAAATSSGSGGPLAVHRGKKVLDACPEARARGVHVGMPLAEARSVLATDGTFVEWEEESYREASRRWLEIVARYSDAVEPLSQHEALADLSGHPRPREAAAMLERDLRKAGFLPRCGLAPCRWVARLAARRGDPLGLAHADPRAYVADVPTTSLPIDPEAARRLLLLGYRTAGEVASLPLSVLSAQFGDRSHGIVRASLGRGDALVRPLFPENAVSARFAFEVSPETRQDLDAGLARVAREIGAGLGDLDAAGRAVELFLEREDGSVERIVRTFARPLTGEDDVANALGLMLPLSPREGIESVRARLPGVAAARRTQLDLQGGRSRSDAAEGVRAALGHVREAFGDGAVRLLADIPEPRWVRLRRAYRQLNGWVW